MTKRGFTLIEILIYMGIIAAFLAVLTEVFLSVLDVQVESQATSNVQIDGRFLLARLIYDIHRASAITAPSSAGASSPSLTLTIAGVSSVYSLGGGRVQLTRNSISSPLTSVNTQITNLNFTRLGNPSPTAKHTLTINFTVTDGRQSKDYQVSVGLR